MIDPTLPHWGHHPGVEQPTFGYGVRTDGWFRTKYPRLYHELHDAGAARRVPHLPAHFAIQQLRHTLQGRSAAHLLPPYDIPWGSCPDGTIDLAEIPPVEGDAPQMPNAYTDGSCLRSWERMRSNTYRGALTLIRPPPLSADPPSLKLSYHKKRPLSITE